jgi:hypothetical protein
LANNRLHRSAAPTNTSAMRPAPPPARTPQTTRAPERLAIAKPPARAAPQTASNAQYRIALMPIAMSGEVFYSEDPLGESVTSAAQRTAGVSVEKSYYRDPDFYDAVNIDAYWNPGFIHRTPNRDAVLTLANSRQFDGVLLVWYEPSGTHLDPDGDVANNTVELFLVDRATGQTRSIKGIHRNVEELTQKLLAGRDG